MISLNTSSTSADVTWPAGLRENAVDEHTLRFIPSRKPYRTIEQIGISTCCGATTLGLLLAAPFYPSTLYGALAVALIAYIAWNFPALNHQTTLEIMRHHNAWKITRSRKNWRESFELFDEHVTGAYFLLDTFGGFPTAVAIRLFSVGDSFDGQGDSFPLGCVIGRDLNLSQSQLQGLRDLFHPAGTPAIPDRFDR